MFLIDVQEILQKQRDSDFHHNMSDCDIKDVDCTEMNQDGAQKIAKLTNELDDKKQENTHWTRELCACSGYLNRNSIKSLEMDKIKGSFPTS
jgi:hypothetical protein